MAFSVQEEVQEHTNVYAISESSSGIRSPRVAVGSFGIRQHLQQLRHLLMHEGHP